jgi:AbrB family looped-hinge helix DNA binding protein
MLTMQYVMKVSRNGQVSIPAEVRARWDVDRVVVVDLGDHVVIGPAHDDPVAALRGKYAGRGPTVDEMLDQSRREDEEDEVR